MDHGRFPPDDKKNRRAFLGLLTGWGLSTAILSSVPEKVIAFSAPHMRRAKRVVAAANQLFGFGAGISGRIGNGSTADVTTASLITGGDLISAVSAGFDHSHFIKSTGTLWALGNGTNGQLGFGNAAVSTPIQIGSDTNWAAVSDGGVFSVALRADNTLWSWGTSTKGQTGDGTNTVRSSPVKIGSDTTWTAVSAGFGHALALKSNGTLWAWGDNATAQLGDGTYVAKSSPVQIGSDTNWTKIYATTAHSMAIKSNGTLWAWGSSELGQVGMMQMTPKQVSAETAWTQFSNRVDAPADFLVGGGMAIKSGGTLWAWGSSLYGEIGDSAKITRESPVQIGGAEWVSVSAAAYHTAGIKTGGSLWTWGGNGDGQLGIGNRSNRSSPVRVGALSDWQTVVTGPYYTAAIKTNGTLWAWGYGPDGVIGQNNFDSYSSPIQVGSATGWTSVSLGGAFAVGIQAGGLWTWGDNTYGQLGTNAMFSLVPAQVGANTWTKAVAGVYHGLAIRSDGTLWAWGDNGNGQLGIGAWTALKSSPTQVGSATTWVDISAAGGNSYGVRSDGTLWAWGYATAGWPLLGTGGTNSINAPAQIPGTTWTKVSGGYFGAIAQKTDGTLWTWGLAFLGAPMNAVTSPVQVGTDTNWAEVAGGDWHTTAIKTNGAIYTWGAGLTGTLTNSQFPFFTSPVKIGSGSTWSKVSANGRMNIALQSNGTAWGWGTQSRGQLGIGNTTYQSNPVQLSGTTWVAVSAGTLHTLGKKT